MTTTDTTRSQRDQVAERPTPRRPYVSLRRRQAATAARYRLTHIVRTASMGMLIHRAGEM